ncbi:MAG TPA: hypothetical protein VML55_00290 [Planctomycetaceae bacterium]|nr:hypothetical protein [Planctomycetaceae bacterium]
MQQRRFHSGRFRFALRCRAWRAPLCAAVRIAMLLAFTAASLGLPLGAVDRSEDAVEAEAGREGQRPPAGPAQVIGGAQVQCVTSRTNGCGCSATVQRAGRCCCARPLPAAGRKSCCVSGGTEMRSDGQSDEAPSTRNDVGRRESRACGSAIGRTGSPPYGEAAARDREAPADPVLHCPCGQSDLAWTIASAEPRLLNSPACLPRAGGRSSALGGERVRRPVNSAAPETPPPEGRAA